MNPQKFQNVNTTFTEVQVNDAPALRVVKANKLNQFDENTYAKLKDCQFHNGIIEVKMLSRLLANAPDFARGFIGLAFRINDLDSAFEAFYVRPTNGLKQTNDPIRQSHAWQYFSYPKYTFAYLREHQIQGFEGPADLSLDQWLSLKVVVEDAKGEFYLNQQSQPVLTVDSLKMGAQAQGSIGLFVDVGTAGYFKDLKITMTD